MVKKCFTLVEVIVALAVMGLALTAFFALSQSAVNRVDKAYASWERMHLLSQAAEYCLLFPEEEVPDMPADVFESNIYDIEISYADAENLPEELNNLDRQAPLRTLVLDLVDARTREIVDTLKIDRIDFDSVGDMD